MGKVKRVFTSKTILFFLALLAYTVGGELMKVAQHEEIAFTDVNWVAIFSAVMGIVLRFVTNRPLLK